MHVTTEFLSALSYVFTYKLTATDTSSIGGGGGSSSTEVYGVTITSTREKTPSNSTGKSIYLLPLFHFLYFFMHVILSSVTICRTAFYFSL